MLSSIIPAITPDFNFDIVLIMIFTSYLLYGYFSGGHKQIRISITLSLPFIIIFYMGSTITTYLYAPLSETFVFEIIAEYLGILKNTIGMIFAYFITYFLLFTGIFILSIFARKYILNENMRAKLGPKNNYIGAIFGFINGYVLVYFIILPAFSLNLVGTNAHLTNFVLKNPPPFSRIARTAEKAVPVKGLADKAANFQALLSVEGIEGYYNDSIYEYQQQYVGGTDSFESDFMLNVYSKLTANSKGIIDDAYFDYFGNDLSQSRYYGVSLVLIQEGTSEDLVYEDILVSENEFHIVYETNLEVIKQHETALTTYDKELQDYDYQLKYDQYIDKLDVYLLQLGTYTTNKLTALKTETEFLTSFNEHRPVITIDEPLDFVYNLSIDTDGEPTDPLNEDLTAVNLAIIFVDTYKDKEIINDKLQELGTNFEKHEGLLVWYIDELSSGQNYDLRSSDISTVINSFKLNYKDIIDDLDDKELRDKLYLAAMSIRSYDVFTEWVNHTTGEIDIVALDDIELEVNRCPKYEEVYTVDYDFTNDVLDIVATLFEGESVSWIITQYKYDYEAGYFTQPFEDYEEVQDVLVSTKELVDEYEEKYKDIANSIEGNISMIFKISISVMKYNLDVYDTLENTPLISAVFNDAARFCGSLDTVSGYDIEICRKSDGQSGTVKEIMNMRYLISEIYFKAYLMVDDENNRIYYDTEEMHIYLATVHKSVEDNVITKEVIIDMGNQFAFNIIDETTNLTLLEQMYEDGYITIEAMRVLAEDDYELFSEDFRARVKSLIR